MPWEVVYDDLLLQYSLNLGSVPCFPCPNLLQNLFRVEADEKVLVGYELSKDWYVIALNSLWLSVQQADSWI